MVNIGDLFPNFQANTTMGPLQFYDWVENSWCLFLSYQSDFTPVSTTELSELVQMQYKFEKEIDIKLYGELKHISNLPYPIIADERRDLAVELDIIDINTKGSLCVPLSSSTTFIIDSYKNLQFSSCHSAKIGRSFDEILRVIDALQLTDNRKIATPVNWMSGQPVLLLSNMSEDQIVEQHPDVRIRQLPSGKRYMKLIPQPLI